MLSKYYLALSKIETFRHNNKYYYYCEGIFFNIPLKDYFEYIKITGANKYA